jgi:CRISPR/Cas system endoribonuclease Cas6 (RAMP superfamily)
MAVELAPVKMKNSLKIYHVESNLIKSLILKVKEEFPNFLLLLHDNEFLTYICCLIENTVKSNSKKKKPNKKFICIQTLSELFTLDPASVAVIERQIDYIHDNGRIKKIKVTKKILKFVTGWIAKKFA